VTEFDSLVDAHSGEIYGYLWRLTRDPADAQDCLQESFLRAYQAYGRLANQTNLRAWLYRIATNTAFTHLKRRRRERARTAPLVVELTAGGPLPDEALAQRERLAAVAAAVDRLPRQQRAALILRKYQELGYGEIGHSLGCTEAAARANVYQAVKRLRSELATEDED
jgi:RNA polymerase sigma-70 factor (ECF subfamily)